MCVCLCKCKEKKCTTALSILVEINIMRKVMIDCCVDREEVRRIPTGRYGLCIQMKERLGG